MPTDPADTHAPPPDLDIPAARAAAEAYAGALRRGLPDAAAWEEASTLFALFHPSWPLPLAEREAARTVGALIACMRPTTASPRRGRPPSGLLRRLAEPAHPDAEVAGDPAMASRPRPVSPPLSPYLLAGPPFLPPPRLAPGAGSPRC